MRVKQVQNLAWAANVAVFMGMGFVVWQFWLVKFRAPPAEEVEWPEVGGARQQTAGAGRWPGELSAFQHIWLTPVNGLVPPPPPPPVKQPPPDPSRDFKNKMQFRAAWIFLGQPSRSVAQVEYTGQRSMRVGERVDSWQLVALGRDPETGRHSLTFRHPEVKDDVTIEEKPLPGDGPFAKPGPFISPAFGGAVEPGAISENSVPQQAFRDPASGEFVIPHDEQVWWETYGEKKVLERLQLQEVTDPKDATPRGVKLKRQPETGTPLEGSRGINAGDVIVSINGQPIRTKADILAYLRGPGRGLARYEVVVDTSGKERTVVYNLR